MFPRGHQIITQEIVTDHLPLYLLSDTHTVIGAYGDDNELVGVAALGVRRDTDGLVWGYIPVIAVASGHHRRGIGENLKIHLLGLAEAAGGSYVQSDVHYENTAMIELNSRKFGARVVPAVDGMFVTCIVDLPWPF